MPGVGLHEAGRGSPTPLERATDEAVRAVLAVVVPIMLLSAVFDGASLPAPEGRYIVGGDLVTAAASALARVAWKRSPGLRRRAAALSFSLGVTMAANAIATMWVSRDVQYTAQLVLLIVCASSVFDSAPWLLAFAAVAVAGWCPFAARIASGGAFATALFGLALASIAAAVFHWTRVRIHSRVGVLQARDQRRRDRLRKALQRARSELEQRRRAEVEGGRLRDQLLQAQKMEAVARLAGGVAHDMNNVLTSITTIGEVLLEDDRLDPVARDDLASMLSAARRGATLSRNLLAFSRQGKYSSDILGVAALVDSARHLLARTLPEEIELEVELQDVDLQVEGDANQLVQAIVNVCTNAADAMPDGGVIWIRTAGVELGGDEAHRRAVAPGAYVAIRVQDTGPGMDSETRRVAFEPFFTTKPQGGGAGLGLAMVYGTARNHGGHAEVESAAGGGTVVTLHLPRATRRVAGDSAAPPPSGPRADLGARSVLLVDDEPSVRAVAKRILERIGLRVHTAENGRRALAVWTADGPFDLVVLDMAMPVMGGREFFSRVRKLDPTARVLLVSGFAPDDDARELLAAGALGFIEKPYTPTSLTRAVRSALAREPPASAGELGS